MTGYQSKKAAAQDKLNNDDDTQVYGDALTIAYQSGYYDGKKAAQAAQEPVCPACKAGVLYECVACSSNNYPPQGAQKPVAWMYDWLCEGKLITGWIAHSDSKIHQLMGSNIRPLYTAPPQRPWVGLTDDEVYKIAFTLEGEHWKKIANAIESKLKEKNK